MANSIEVLYLEEDPEGEDLKARWCDLLNEVGVSARVRIVGDFDEVLNSARSGALDIFVCDLSLGNDADDRWAGLGLLRQIKDEFPGVLTIGTTGGYPKYRSIDVEGDCFHVFVPKDPLRNNIYSDYAERIRKAWKILPDIAVTVVGSIASPLSGTAPNAKQISNIVRQLFARPSPPQPSELLPRIMLEQLSGGRSASTVFSMKSLERKGVRRTIPAILKVSEIADHEEELARYERFIKWSLPDTARVDMLGEGRVNNFGGIAYSFAHGGEKITTLTGLFNEKDYDRAKHAIDRLFDNNRQLWAKLDGGSSFDLSRRYLEKYYWLEEKTYYRNVEKFFSTVSDVGLNAKRSRHVIKIGDLDFANPSHILSQYNPRNIRTSICHGDMNSNNIIISDSGAVALIDFRDAGIGHVFEDITTLEGCIRLFWGQGSGPPISDPQKTLSQMLEIERALVDGKPHSGTSRAWALIEHIRSRAMKSFGDEPTSTYYFGLAYYCLRLFRFKLDDPWVVIRLLACILVCCENLDGGDQ